MLPMDTKLFYIITILLVCSCCDEQFPEAPRLIVPYTIDIENEEVSIGDTIWISAKFSNQLSLDNSDQKFVVDQEFNFFTELGFLEISSEVERYDFSYNLFATRGTVELFPSSLDLFSHWVTYDYEDGYFSMRAGLILHDPGLYLITLVGDNELVLRSNSEALEKCNGRNREAVTVLYRNSNTTRANYDGLFQTTSVTYLPRLVTWEEFRDGAAMVFRVIE